MKTHVNNTSQGWEGCELNCGDRMGSKIDVYHDLKIMYDKFEFITLKTLISKERAKCETIYLEDFKIFVLGAFVRS